jgi:hypothetical protein
MACPFNNKVSYFASAYGIEGSLTYAASAALGNKSSVQARPASTLIYCLDERRLKP